MFAVRQWRWQQLQKHPLQSHQSLVVRELPWEPLPPVHLEAQSETSSSTVLGNVQATGLKNESLPSEFLLYFYNNYKLKYNWNKIILVCLVHLG